MFLGLCKQIHATCFPHKLRPRATSKEQGASYATDTHHLPHQVPCGSISAGHPRPACLKGPWTEVSRFKCLRHNNVHKSESEQGTGAAAEGRTKGKRGKCKYIIVRINMVTARMGSHPSDLRLWKVPETVKLGGERRPQARVWCTCHHDDGLGFALSEHISQQYVSCNLTFKICFY